MAIGFMSFGGMLTGGDEEKKEISKVDSKIEKKELITEDAKEIVADNTNTNKQ